MAKKDLVKILLEKPGYLKSGPGFLMRKFNVTEQEAKEALLTAKRKETINNIKELNKDFNLSLIDPLYTEFLEWKKTQIPVKSKKKEKLPEPFLKGDPDNVLVIGDLHEPFCLKEYLHFCREMQEKDNCGTVVFIGDIIDNHYSSFHESESETYGPNKEFELAKEKIQRWYKVFPEAYVTVGNHDRLVHRKAKSAGIADQWIIDYSTALDTPGWKFVHEVVLNNVCYNHGEGGTASTRMKTELLSQVQGHLHSQFYIQYAVGASYRLFGVQTGCGIDRNSFAFAYGKNGPKPIIGCGTVLNKGTLPCLYPMNL